MAERDDDRAKPPLPPEVPGPKKTLAGLGGPSLPPPRPLSAPKAASQTQIKQVSLSQLDAELDMMTSAPVAGEDDFEDDDFEGEKTQVGSMAEMFGTEGAPGAAVRPQAPSGKPNVSPVHNAPTAAPATPAAVVAPAAPPASPPAPSAVPQAAPVSAPQGTAPQPLIQSQVSPYEPTQALPTPIFSSGDPPTEVPPPEGEFEAQKTQMLSSPYEYDAPVVKIYALSGPAAGQEFFVNGMRTTVGRGETNSAMVPDVAMSRQHFEIVKNPDESYTLYDLQSINGTAINGTRVRECDLFHGDRIEAGKTVFQFLVHGQLPTPQRQRRVVTAVMSTMAGQGFHASPERGGTVIANTVAAPQGLMKLSTIITIVAGVCSLVLLVLIVVMVASGDGNDSPDAKALASQRYLQGVEAVREHQWDTAESLFLEAQKHDPQLDVKAQLDRIVRERDANRLLEGAKTKFEAGDFDGAARLAVQIPSDSIYHSEVQPYTKRPQVIAVDEVLQRAQDKVTQDDLEGAKELIAQIRDRVSDHQGAADLEARIQKIEDDRKADAEVAAQRAREVAAQEQTASRKVIEVDPFADLEDDTPAKKPTASNTSSRVVNFTEGFRLYKAKQFDEAAAYFSELAQGASGASAERATKTATEIEAFKKVYASANAAYDKQDWKAADKLLTQARRTDSAVAGGRGYFESELATKLATARGQLGLAAFAGGDFSAAFKYQRDGEKQDASNPTVKELRNKLLVEARSLYIKAANARKSNPNEAAKLCRTIMAMIPESEDTWKKAQNMVKEL